MRDGLSDLVEVLEGDALQTLASDLPEQVDLVLRQRPLSFSPLCDDEELSMKL